MTSTPVDESSLCFVRIAHPPTSLDGALGCDTQWPFGSHTNGSAQSVTAPQLVLHVLPSQMYGAQSVRVPFGLVTVCCPSQLAPDTHLPVVVSHLFPGMQSPFTLHATPQTLPLHANVPQAEGGDILHPPLPSQLPVACACPFAQLGSPHDTAGPT